MTQPVRELNLKIRLPRLARGRKRAAVNLLAAGLGVGAAYVGLGTAWALAIGSLATFALGWLSEVPDLPEQEGQR